MNLRFNIASLLLLHDKNKSSLVETACRFALGVVAELLSQGQMTGLCTRT